MTRSGILFVLLVSLAAAGGSMRAAAAVPPETIINMEKAALDRWSKGDPDGYLEIMVPDVTYFDPNTDARVDGRDKLKPLLDVIRGKLRIERIEMINPKVQQSGDLAVLTFNLISHGGQLGDGPKRDSHWNTTEVYQRIGGRWRIVHSHFSNIKPLAPR